jgi:hypothetical protein
MTQTSTSGNRHVTDHIDDAPGSSLPRNAQRRWLCRFDDDTVAPAVFAYARGHELFRCSDHASWASFSDGVLRSGRSGEPIAYAIGDVLYDASTHTPMYYFVDA